MGRRRRGMAVRLLVGVPVGVPLHGGAMGTDQHGGEHVEGSSGQCPREGGLLCRRCPDVAGVLCPRGLPIVVVLA